MSDDMNPATAPGRTVYRVDRQQKRALLKHLITEHNWARILVYVRTKYAAVRLGRQLTQDGCNVVVAHNSMGKARKAEAIAAFSSGEARIFISSDMATRGMALPASMDCVVNLDLPTAPCLAQREAHMALAQCALFLLGEEEQAALHTEPAYVTTDYRFTVAAGFEPTPEAQQTAIEPVDEPAREKPTPRRLKRSQAGKKASGRKKPGWSDTGEKKPVRRQAKSKSTQLDENGDVNGNTLVSDNANRSAIDLACDGAAIQRKRGNPKLKSGPGSRRTRHATPSIMGG